ncbi:DUF2909 domain-containing protein [Neiella sp. HB171785]|uniref:DUF2909 domain-containing protein n=1 Tax=Neiella litorisoli TaxID=2771431 RepID=A0A8J6QVA6_9GAMM|nr:DUF2909 family protein [Neiella litorisoli]MBD1391132.1 DUF2909 domain-containing protein [Neiella litorisoli]
MHWLLKALIVILLVSVIVNLALALKQMLATSKSAERPQKSMSSYIGRRLIFSAAILLLLLLFAASGNIAFNPRPY